MRAGSLILLLLLAAAADSRDTGSAAAVERIASCAAGSGDEEGLEALEEACPGLREALDDSGYRAFIPESARESLTRGGLEDLRALDARDQSQHAVAAAHDDVAKLAPVLRDLDQQRHTEQPLSWLDRVQRWLEGLLQRRQAGQDSWLARWLRDFAMPQRVSQIILYGSIVLIVVIAIGVIVNEMRAAGIFRGGRRRRHGKVIEGAGSAMTNPVLPELNAVPISERPAVLLRMLVNSLLATGRLRTEKSLTHRELSVRAAFDADEQRNSFNQVAALSELIMYGNRAVAADEIDAVLQAGRRLDEQLNSPRVVT